MTKNSQINDFSINESSLENIAYLYKEFQDTIELWVDIGVWKLINEHVYSNWLKRELLRLKISISEFVEYGFTKPIDNNYCSDSHLLRHLSTSIMKHGEIIPALIQVNGWKGKIGLELAKAHILEFFETTGRIPVRNDKNMNRIRMAATKGFWKEFGISGWNDLLYSIFNRVTKIMNFYTGEKGLDRAKDKIIKFYEKNNRIPTTQDEEMEGIQTACLKGYWKKDGISNWNDLLKDTLGMINKGTRIYVGLKGLNFAKNELLKFFTDYDRIPKAKEMLKIQSAFKGKYWVKFGIGKWNDLLFEVFNQVNTQPNLHKGTKGLHRAKKIIKEFYIKNGRIPNCKDQGMLGIYEAARKGSWIDIGISSWHELLSDIFNKEEISKYIGLKGFSSLCKEITDFSTEKNRTPKFEEFETIAKYCNSGKWKKYGVNNWDDLLNFNFGDVNQRKSGTSKYIGLKGINLVKKEIMDFYNINKRKPTRNEFSHIMVIWNNQLWKDYGIQKWNDLILEIFGEVNKLMNYYKEGKGLERAKGKLKQFYKKYNRIPKAREFNSIAQYCSRGYWKKYEIYKWNDLIKDVFGRISKSHEIWKGNTGLRRAKEKIKIFYEVSGRIPSSKDKGMGGISDAAGRKGYWRKIGIKSWIQLIQVVFDDLN